MKSRSSSILHFYAWHAMLNRRPISKDKSVLISTPIINTNILHSINYQHGLASQPSFSLFQLPHWSRELSIKQIISALSHTLCLFSLVHSTVVSFGRRHSTCSAGWNENRRQRGERSEWCRVDLWSGMMAVPVISWHIRSFTVLFYSVFLKLTRFLNYESRKNNTQRAKGECFDPLARSEPHKKSSDCVDQCVKVGCAQD